MKGKSILGDILSTTNIASGHLDIVLLKIISMGDCYGYSISKTITYITNHSWELKEATLYSGLRRLESGQMIESYWGDESQGGRRKYYAITDHGREELQQSVNRWALTRNNVDRILAWEGNRNE